MISQDITAAAVILADAGVVSPLYDAQLIAAHLLGCSRTDLFLRSDDSTPAGFHDAVARRARREPLQHILGVAPMGPLELRVGPGVFIPRPETELLAEWGVSVVAGVDKPTVVDLCTGSGAIAAYVATVVPAARVTAVEIDSAAAEWAQANFDAFAPQVEFVMGDATYDQVLPQLRGACDLVLSNPPYVPEAAEVETEVHYDPPQAVFGGVSGMDVITPMIDVMLDLLKPRGYLGIEHDDTTSAEVKAVLAATGRCDEIVARRDLAGRERFVTARKL